MVIDRHVEEAWALLHTVYVEGRAGGLIDVSLFLRELTVAKNDTQHAAPSNQRTAAPGRLAACYSHRPWLVRPRPRTPPHVLSPRHLQGTCECSDGVAHCRRLPDPKRLAVRATAEEVEEVVEGAGAGAGQS